MFNHCKSWRANASSVAGASPRKIRRYASASTRCCEAPWPGAVAACPKRLRSRDAELDIPLAGLSEKAWRRPRYELASLQEAQSSVPKRPNGEAFLALELPVFGYGAVPTAQDLQTLERLGICFWPSWRFSVTLESGDRAAVLAMADEMDRGRGFCGQEAGVFVSFCGRPRRSVMWLLIGSTLAEIRSCASTSRE